MKNQGSDRQASIKELTNLLFEVFLDENGKQVTNAEVAKNSDITDGAISSIRTRDLKNPTINTLEAIASFFNVPLDYFKCKTMEEARLYLGRLRSGLSPYKSELYKGDEVIGQIMAKAISMSDDARRDVLRMMEWFEYGDKARIKAKTAKVS